MAKRVERGLGLRNEKPNRGVVGLHFVQSNLPRAAQPVRRKSPAYERNAYGRL